MAELCRETSGRRSLRSLSQRSVETLAPRAGPAERGPRPRSPPPRFPTESRPPRIESGSAHRSAAGVDRTACRLRFRASAVCRLEASDPMCDLRRTPRAARVSTAKRRRPRPSSIRPAAPIPLLVGTAERYEHARRATRAAQRMFARAWRGGRSCSPPRGGRTARTRARPGSDAAVGCRLPAGALPPLPRAGCGPRSRTCRILRVMSSPNHFACSLGVPSGRRR